MSEEKVFVPLYIEAQGHAEDVLSGRLSGTSGDPHEDPRAAMIDAFIAGYLFSQEIERKGGSDE